VTGGAGFIGSHLVAALLARGDRVRVLDDFSSGRRDFLPDHPGLEVVAGDVRDPGALRGALAEVDVVYHQAALRSVPRSVEYPYDYHDVNVTGTLRLLLAARDAGVRRVVFASSSSVYGEQAILPLHEELRPLPISPYGASKLAGEHYCANFARHYGLQTVALRYFNVFGPRQDPASEYSAVIARFIEAAGRGAPVEIHGDGKQTRDFTFVDNVVSANLLALEKDVEPGLVVNIGAGERLSIEELFRAMAEIAGGTVDPIHAPPRVGDVHDSLASLARAREALGYEPRSGWKDGLVRTMAWYRARSAATHV
jgi:nucleoside-diphosphate-sugar epimerase